MPVPKTLEGAWNDINRRFFDSTLPKPTLRWVPDNAEGAEVDTRHERAATSMDSEGGWVVEVNEGMREFPRATYLVLAHEAIHVKIGLDADHKSAAWRKEVRRLTGKRLLERVL